MPVTFTFSGKWLKPVQKTGVFVEVFDTISEKVYYQNQFYSGKDSFAAQDALAKEIRWLLPSYMP